MKYGSDYIRYFQFYNLNQIIRTELYTGSDICLKLLLLPQAVRVVVHPLAASHWELKPPDTSLLLLHPHSPSVPPRSPFCPHSLRECPCHSSWASAWKGLNRQVSVRIHKMLWKVSVGVGLFPIDKSFTVVSFLKISKNFLLCPSHQSIQLWHISCLSKVLGLFIPIYFWWA